MELLEQESFTSRLAERGDIRHLETSVLFHLIFDVARSQVAGDAIDFERAPSAARRDKERKAYGRSGRSWVVRLLPVSSGSGCCPGSWVRA